MKCVVPPRSCCLRPASLQRFLACLCATLTHSSTLMGLHTHNHHKHFLPGKRCIFSRVNTMFCMAHVRFPTTSHFGSVFRRETGVGDSPFPSQPLRQRHDTLSTTIHLTSTSSQVPLVLTLHSTQDTRYPTLPHGIFTSASHGGCRGKVAPKDSQRRKYHPLPD